LRSNGVSLREGQTRSPIADGDQVVSTATTHSAQEIDDRTLADRVCAGDHAAFTMIFERHKNRIYRFCVLMLGDEVAAQDVYQEVFVNFYRACREGRDMYNVVGYLITSARTRCINSMRTLHRNASLDDVAEPGYEIDFTSFDLGEHLRTALQKIPFQYREAFLLFEVEGYSYNEIAEYLDVNLGIVKNRIYRAKHALQKILRPMLGDE
jgi:RNA polymerase sigma-70 factor (ECF subfamily)